MISFFELKKEFNNDFHLSLVDMIHAQRSHSLGPLQEQETFLKIKSLD